MSSFIYIINYYALKKPGTPGSTFQKLLSIIDHPAEWNPPVHPALPEFLQFS